MPNEKDDNNDKKKPAQPSKDEQQSEHIQNPFGHGQGKEVTQEDIDNEQKFKEAFSERD